MRIRVTVKEESGLRFRIYRNKVAPVQESRSSPFLSAFFSFVLPMLVLVPAAASAGEGLAPDVAFETTDGQSVSLSDYRGKVVVLNLWAIWCGPCIAEIPELVELQRLIEPRAATVIGLALDSGSADQVLAFWDRRLNLAPRYPLWLTSMEQAESLFGATTLPLTLLIDREGVVQKRMLGAHDAETFMQELRVLL